MRTIKLILIGMAFAVFVVFVAFNWSDVDITLGTWLVHIKIPALVLLAFLAGFLPTYLMHLASRSSWQRRLSRSERAVTEAVLHKAQPAPPPFPTSVPPAP
jgi:uncharacterized integral membrane protein